MSTGLSPTSSSQCPHLQRDKEPAQEPQHEKRPIPHVASDASIPLLFTQGYNFIQNQCDKLHSDIFQMTIGLEPAIFMYGEAAAKLFYSDRFKRTGVMPIHIRKSLLGSGGAHSLDDAPHHERKALFMGLMTEERLALLNEIVAQEWEARIQTWQNKSAPIRLLDQTVEVFTKAICKWAGIQLPDEDVSKRGADLFAMVDAFGSIGPRNWKGILARRRAEKWLSEIVGLIRDEELKPPIESAANVFSFHTTHDGKLLPARTAAVEILNVVRPTIAVAYFVVFAALTLHKHPQYREQLKNGDETFLECWVQELRRFYPFAPIMGAFTRRAFNWNGYHFPEGRLVVLGLYATDHDPRIWEKPFDFNPDNIKNWNGSAHNFIPHGGGGFLTGHRCAGEWIAINLLKITTRVLVNRVEYHVPEKQDLSYSMVRMPTFCKSHFLIDQVRVLPQTSDMVQISAKPRRAYLGDEHERED